MLRSPIRFTRLFLKNPGILSKNSSVHWISTTEAEENQQNQSSINQNDVQRHTQLKNEWWNPKGPLKALHSYNYVRVPFIRDGLVQVPISERTRKPLIGKKILDVGCGGGILSEALARLGAEVTGIDASQELIELAQEHSCKSLCDNRPTYYCTPVEDHSPKYLDYYDGVVASEIIEHIDNDKKELFVISCIDALKPGGKIFFTTPTRSATTRATLIFLAEYVFNIVPRGTHQYEKFMTPNELTFLCERNGCYVEMVLGLFYEMFTNKWYFISNSSQLFALQAIKN